MEKVITIGTISNIQKQTINGSEMIAFMVSYKPANSSFVINRKFATSWKLMIDKIIETPDNTIVLVESEIQKANTYKDKNGETKAAINFNLKHFERLDYTYNATSKTYAELASNEPSKKDDAEEIFKDLEDWI